MAPNPRFLRCDFNSIFKFCDFCLQSYRQHSIFVALEFRLPNKFIKTITLIVLFVFWINKAPNSNNNKHNVASRQCIPTWATCIPTSIHHIQYTLIYLSLTLLYLTLTLLYLSLTLTHRTHSYSLTHLIFYFLTILYFSAFSFSTLCVIPFLMARFLVLVLVLILAMAAHSSKHFTTTISVLFYYFLRLKYA